jgi:tetratricopeptide (TPR) repeat protein
VSCFGLAAIFATFLFAPQTDLKALLEQIEDSIERQDNSSARVQLKAAFDKYPGNSGLNNLLGVLDAGDGNYPSAERAFRTAVTASPRFTAAWLNLGRLYQQQPDPDKALAVYESILRYEPANTEANYQAAVLLLAKASYRPALQHAMKLPADLLQQPHVLSVICGARAGLNESTLAKETARKMLASPELAEVDVLAALPAAEKLANPALASLLLEELSRRKLASPESMHRLGLVYERQKRFAEARATLDEVTAAQPNSAILLTELARVAYQQRDLTATLGYLAHARDLEPQNSGVHFFFGMVAVELDLPLEARASLEQAVRLAPENAFANYALGAVAVQGRVPSEAVPYFRKYCQLKPADPRGRFALGTAYFYAKDYEAARKELAPIADNPATAAGAHYLLGRVAMQDDRLDEAAMNLRRAVGLNPRNADAWAELGLVYTRQENYTEAQKTLDRAVALDPEGFLPNLNLLVLYQRSKDSRAEQQKSLFEEIKKKRTEKQESLLRTIEVRPY